MADGEDKVDLSPAALRKMMEQASDKAISRFVKSIGYDDADDLREALTARPERGGDREPVTNRRSESQRERYMREAREALEAEQAEKKREADERAAAKKAEDDRAAQLTAIQAEADLKVELLAAGVKKSDLKHVMREYADKRGTLDEKAAGAFKVESFLAELGTQRPYFFEDGRVPEPPKEGDAGNGHGPDTSSGPQRTAVKPVKPALKDYSTEPYDAVRARITELAGRARA